MTAYAVAWALCGTIACFVVLAVVIVLESRDERRARTARAARAERQQRVPAPRLPSPTSAAAIVTVGDPEAFDAFLAELICTPHVEGALR